MTTVNNNNKIQVLKNFIVSNAFAYGWNTASKRELGDEAETIVDQVAKFTTGFASEIAQTVLKYKKVSEKQAYWIAKAAVENNKDTRVEFLYAA